METIQLLHTKNSIEGNIHITGSKSISNRLLILNEGFGRPFTFKNLSNAEDTQLLQKALNANDDLIDIHHAGTSMRFLTAFYAFKEGANKILTGSSRMKERPIGILVDALRSVGAKIEYVENEGFPPLKIRGTKITKNEIELPANISSQYITALMLIAPLQQNGLKIHLKGKITSRPYILMTMNIMRSIGIAVDFNGNTIQIQPKDGIEKREFTVESDWSSASYYYSIAAIKKKSFIQLSSLSNQSTQGDSAIHKIYDEYFGVKTSFDNDTVTLTKKHDSEKEIILDLNKTPDIAQTIAVTCAVLRKKCKLTGLETLKIKETDRLVALQNELKRIGAITEITDSTLEIVDYKHLTGNPTIQTYNDHRMAMAFAPASLLFSVQIQNPKVVEKSYPDFWIDLEKLGFKITR